jgi:hypothetical protein
MTGGERMGAHSNEWMGVTKAFLEHAFKDATGRLVKCPCNRCENNWPQKKEEMEKHLCKSGFMPNYLVWYRHGESIRYVDAVVELGILPATRRGRRETARAHSDVSSWDSHKTNGDKVEAQHFKQCLQRHRPTDGRGSLGES